MKEGMKNIGGIAMALVVIAAIAVLGALIVMGGIWVSATLLPIAHALAGLTFLLCLFVLIPLAVFHRSRGFAGMALVLASYLFGFTLWMTGLLMTYVLWGAVGAIIGLFLFGFGVVPTALLATLFHGEGQAFLFLIVLIVVTYGSRAIGFYAMCKYEQERGENTSPAPETAASRWMPDEHPEEHEPPALTCDQTPEPYDLTVDDQKLGTGQAA